MPHDSLSTQVLPLVPCRAQVTEALKRADEMIEDYRRERRQAGLERFGSFVKSRGNTAIAAGKALVLGGEHRQRVRCRALDPALKGLGSLGFRCLCTWHVMRGYRFSSLYLDTASSLTQGLLAIKWLPHTFGHRRSTILIEIGDQHLQPCSPA